MFSVVATFVAGGQQTGQQDAARAPQARRRRMKWTDRRDPVERACVRDVGVNGDVALDRRRGPTLAA